MGLVIWLQTQDTDTEAAGLGSKVELVVFLKRTLIGNVKSLTSRTELEPFVRNDKSSRTYPGHPPDALSIRPVFTKQLRPAPALGF